MEKILESYKDDEQLFNLQCWALSCEAFFMPQEWIWLVNEYRYTGDHDFIYFE
tara:strand:- start:354 stop:512 length:159 start_codon:yes stop_codon:yes gene_type:complete